MSDKGKELASLMDDGDGDEDSEKESSSYAPISGAAQACFDKLCKALGIEPSDSAAGAKALAAFMDEMSESDSHSAPAALIISHKA